MRQERSGSPQSDLKRSSILTHDGRRTSVVESVCAGSSCARAELERRGGARAVHQWTLKYRTRVMLMVLRLVVVARWWESMDIFRDFGLLR